LAGIEAGIRAHQSGERLAERAVFRGVPAELRFDVLVRRPLRAYRAA
jgi:hypothetical protein